MQKIGVWEWVVIYKQIITLSTPLLRVDLIKPPLYIYYVSTKSFSFSDFNEIKYVGRGR